MTAAVTGALGGGATILVQALAALYGAAGGINEFLDRHIADLQSSSNETIATTGRILEMAKFGFGLGYLSSVIVICAGQLLLGNPLSAVGTVATAAAMSNPVAMTCGALGAVIYGWAALGASQREALMDRLAQGAAVGVELVRSILSFVVDKAHALLSSDGLKAFKQFIADKAALFGKTLSDVTQSALDAVADGVAAARKRAGEAVSSTVASAEELSATIGETLGALSKSASGGLERTTSVARSIVQRARETDGGTGRDQ